MSATVGPLLAALVLAAVYLLGERLLVWKGHDPRRWVSLGAGISMTYVFLEVLPELGARNREFLAIVGEVSFPEHRIYAMALVGFVALYALDQLVEAAHGSGPSSAARTPIFWAHIVGYALYGWVIGDALVSHGAHGSLSLGLYVVAMGCHLLVVTTSLMHEHGDRYRAYGRWVLAASVLSGWAVAVVAPLSEITLSRLFAFVGGGVLMTSASEELPRSKGGRLGWFIAGVVAYGALLLLA